MGRYQKKHSPTHTHPDHHSSDSPSSGFYGEGQDNRGRSTDHPAAATLSIHPGLGQALNNAGLHTTVYNIFLKRHTKRSVDNCTTATTNKNMPLPCAHS